MKIGIYFGVSAVTVEAVTADTPFYGQIVVYIIWYVCLAHGLFLGPETDLPFESGVLTPKNAVSEKPLQTS